MKLRFCSLILLFSWLAVFTPGTTAAHAENTGEIKRAREIFDAEGAGDISVVDELKPLHS